MFFIHLYVLSLTVLQSAQAEAMKPLYGPAKDVPQVNPLVSFEQQKIAKDAPAVNPRVSFQQQEIAKDAPAANPHDNLHQQRR